ncbi:ATP phosphoribosyltransferase [soil metagenome]
MNEVLRFAIQKSGRLSEDSLSLLMECGIKFNNGMSKLRSPAFNFPLELLFLRDDDIPGYVADGVADAGIAGDNVIEEKGKDIRKVESLGFGRCRLSIALPKAYEYSGINDLQGLHIATSYPKILSQFLAKNNIKASIHEISGSVEIAPGIGLAQGICDIVSSGSTLLSNGLKEVENVLQSEAMLISNKILAANKQDILQKLLFRIRAVNKAKNYRYILLNAPDDSINKIISILPGMKSPTIMPLNEQGWSSLHSVIKENDFWKIIEDLKAAGAEGILVLPIEKMIV